MPLKIRRYDIRLLRQNAFEARIVIGEPLYLGIHLLKTFENRPEPHCRADDLVAETKAVKNFCAALADRNRAARCLLEGHVTTAIFQRQRILRFRCLCSQTACEKCNRTEGGAKRHLAENIHESPRNDEKKTPCQLAEKIRYGRRTGISGDMSKSCDDDGRMRPATRKSVITGSCSGHPRP